MDTMELTQKIKNAPVEQVYGADRMEDLDWIWLSRDLFFDVALLADENIPEEELEAFLRMISDEDFFELLRPRMEEHGFVSMTAKRFTKLDPKQKAFDMDTRIFMSRRYLTKKMIGYGNRFEWILKAMALDMVSYSDTSIDSVYQEYFEGNGRILESMAVDGVLEMDGWRWVLETDTETLVGAFDGQVISKWSARESDNAFAYRSEAG